MTRTNRTGTARSVRFASVVKQLSHRLFGGYAELLRVPHTARFAFAAIIASMPSVMVGMTITLSVQHYYGNYTLAGGLTATLAIASAVIGPLLGTLIDRFGQRQVSLPAIVIWTIAATALTLCIKAHVAAWLLYAIVPFMACVPPWGAMARARWTHIFRNDQERTNRAFSFSGVLDELMWAVGQPLASVLAVISGVLAMAFTGVCVIIGACMFLTELTTCPKSQTELAAEEGLTRKQYREREAHQAKIARADTAAHDARVAATKRGESAQEIERAAHLAYEHIMSGADAKESIWSPGLIAVCATWFGLGAFQCAASLSIIAFATECSKTSYTGFMFMCFSISSMFGALIYGAKHWQIPLWKRFYFCLAVVNLGIATFLFARHLWVIMIIYLLIGVCQAPTWINGNQLMLHLVPPTRFTEGVAWMVALNAIGGSAGSAIAGIWIDRLGSHGGFLVVTTLALLSLLIAFVGFKHIKTSTESPVLTEVV